MLVEVFVSVGIIGTTLGVVVVDSMANPASDVLKFNFVGDAVRVGGVVEDVSLASVVMEEIVIGLGEVFSDVVGVIVVVELVVVVVGVVVVIVGSVQPKSDPIESL